MGKKYIIELEDDYVSANRLYMPVSLNGASDELLLCTDIPLTPYTEPDTQEAYQRGLDDAWEAARKINCYVKDGGLHGDILSEIFNYTSNPLIMQKYTASEAIEKIRQYEEEKEAQALSGEIETWLAESDYTLDEIAEVLEKMREPDADHC